jgi:hypothetical protein
MKMIKSALVGTKELPETNFEDHLRKILREHRTVIISRLLNELPAYIDYKFQSKIARPAIEELRARLTSLKEGYVSLDCYQAIYQMVSTRQLTVLSSEEFYREIDEMIIPLIKVKQLDLV